MGATIDAWVTALGQDPWLIGIMLVIATFILEDAATVTGALLAADGVISPWGALAALYAGIVLGDFGLYGLGWAGARVGFVRRFLERKKVAKAGDWMGKRLVWTVIAARFVPGMRLPTYTACGLFGLSFARFAIAVVGIVGVWTAAAFWAVYVFGEVVIDQAGPWKWPLAALVLVLFIFGPRLVQFALRRRRPTLKPNGTT